MSLVSLKTNLKSLRYGQDRVGGGSSNQPYIKSPIPDNSSSLDRSGGVDFILRGGTLTPSRAAKDVSRLTQMFFDFKSPNGPLFIAKQNLLSRTNVKTQASGFLNQGAYLPTSTILQVAGNAFGIHLNKQGLDPTKRTGPDVGGRDLFGLLGIRDPLGLPIYSEAVTNLQDKKDNRLVKLGNKKLGISLDDTPSPASPVPYSTEILNYSGGPGSILGIGKTTIRRYSNTNEGETKANLSTELPKDKSFYGKTPLSNALNETKNRGLTLIKQKNKIPFKIGMGIPSITSQQGLAALIINPLYPLFPYLKTNTNEGLDFTLPGIKANFEGRYYVLDSTTTFNFSSSRDETQIQDFRENLLKEQATGLKKNILSAAPNYNTPGNRIETRVNLGDPGRRDKNVSSYTKGLGTPLDEITAMPLYQSDIANHRGDRNDLCKFSIGIIDNDNPNLRTYIHFRAFLDSMDDNYTAEWNAFKYMGRGESFYRYGGFTRAINLGWTVAAQSKEELIPMYQKLNFLASSLAPDYSANGYMRGNLAVLTVGGYLFDQPGIINSINYGIPQESPWEIGINDSAIINNDSSIKELPHIIKVTGFSFTPIHKFVPKLQKNTYGGTYNKDNEGLDKVISKFGKDNETGEERYIALATGNSLKDNNYDAPGKNSTWGIIEQAKRKSNQNTSISSTGINLNNSSQLGRTFGSLPSISSEFRATSAQRRANIFGNTNLFNR